MNYKAAILTLAILPVGAQATEFCGTISSLAKDVMDARQRGVAMSTLTAISEKPLYTSIVMEAYDRQRYPVKEIQKRVAEDFRDQMYLECMKLEAKHGNV